MKERTIALEQANERLRVEIADRQRAEEQRERALIEQRDTLAFLAAVSEALAPVVRLEELLDVVRTLPVPFAADWTMVHEQTEEGAIRSEAGVHLFPERVHLLTDLAAVTSASLPADCLIARAIATGQVLIFSDSADDLATRVAGPGEAAALLRALGIGCAAIIPLVALAASALLLGATSVSRFAGSGRMIIEDLARRIRLALDRIQLYREAQEANRLKDEFLSTLSHELRTPLNAVFGWARMLRMRQLDEGTARAVAVIERNAEAQIRLIEDVLDVSRIMTGKMALSMESLNIREVLGATIDAVRPATQAKGVRLDAHLDPDVADVRADLHRLQQVFGNVLSNAVKFTRVGDVITVSLRSVNGGAEIRVADTGVGIRPDVLPFVFDRFRQADSSTTRGHGGLGLGLAIVRHIVELHGGTVAADSPGEGRGATFTIWLPLDRATHVSTPTETAAPALSLDVAQSEALHGRKVLVVEDHDDARELVASVLGAAGAEVISATSTREALDCLARHDTRPVVGGSGSSRRRRLHASAAHPRDENLGDRLALPAVAITAYARASDRERALAAGFLRYVVKPVDPAELVNLLASVLETRR